MSILQVVHENGEVVKIGIGMVYRTDDQEFSKRDLKLNRLFINDDYLICGVFCLDSGFNIDYPLHRIHNLPAKTMRTMTQSERIAVLRGGCEVKGRDGQWIGNPQWWMREDNFVICGDNFDIFTHYRCAPDWTVEREFVKEVDG